jgi:hypothetical protein
MTLEERINRIEEKLGLLEKPVVRTTLCLPEGRQGGVLFNLCTVNARFEKAEDGVYYSDSALLMSARSSGYEDSFDYLQAYLNQTPIREQLGQAFGVSADHIHVTLPEASLGRLKYNGAVCAYWLKGMSGYRAHRRCVDGSGVTGSAGPDSALGCVFVAHVTRP